MTEFLTTAKEVEESINMATAAIAEKLRVVTEDRNRQRQARYELQCRVNKAIEVLDSGYGPYSAAANAALVRGILEGTQS